MKNNKVGGSYDSQDYDSQDDDSQDYDFTQNLFINYNQESNKLIANTDNINRDGYFTYQWQISEFTIDQNVDDDGDDDDQMVDDDDDDDDDDDEKINFIDLIGQTKKEISIIDSYNNKLIRVTAVYNNQTIFISPYKKIDNNKVDEDVNGNIMFEGDVKEGSKLKMIYPNYDYNYQWQLGDENLVFKDIEDESLPFFIIPFNQSYVDKYIRLKVVHKKNVLISSFKKIEKGDYNYYHDDPTSVYDKYEESALHALFDNFLNPNIGSYYINPLRFFMNVFENYYVNYENLNVYKILKESHKNIITIKNLKLKDYTFEIETKFIFGNTKIKKIKSIEFIDNWKSTSFILKTKKEEKKYSTVNVNDDEDISINILIDLAEYLYGNIVDKLYLKKNNNYIIPSGWSTEGGGHLISLYINKKNKNSFDLTIFNSGSGIYNHKFNKLNNKYNIAKYKENTNKDEAKKIISFLILLKVQLTKKPDHRVLNEYYYNVIMNIFEFTDNLNDDILYQKEQLSGSCTFFGYYYNLLYIINSDEENLEKFKNTVIKYSQINLLKNLDKKKVLKNYDKDIINLIKFNLEKITEIDEDHNQKVNENVNNLLKRYRENLKSFKYTNDNKEEIKKFLSVKKNKFNQNKNIELINIIYYLIFFNLKNEENNTNKLKMILIINYIVELLNSKSDDFFIFNFDDYETIFNEFNIRIPSYYDFKSFRENYFIKSLSNLSLIISSNLISPFLIQFLATKIIYINYRRVCNFENLKYTDVDTDKNDDSDGDSLDDDDDDDIYYRKYFSKKKKNYNINSNSNVLIKPFINNNSYENIYISFYKLFFTKIVTKMTKLEIGSGTTYNYEHIIFDGFFNKEEFNKLDQNNKNILLVLILIASNNNFKSLDELEFKYDNNEINISAKNRSNDVNEIKNDNYLETNINKREILIKYNYTNIYKIIEFINNSEINNINNYYNNFYYFNFNNYNSYSSVVLYDYFIIFDELLLIKNDIFDLDIKNDNIIYNKKNDDFFLINESYSSSFKTKKMLINNLKQDLLTDDFNNINDFAKINIIILLYHFDIDINKDLIKKINSYINNLDEKNDFYTNFKLINILINNDDNEIFEIYKDEKIYNIFFKTKEQNFSVGKRHKFYILNKDDYIDIYNEILNIKLFSLIFKKIENNFSVFFNRLFDENFNINKIDKTEKVINYNIFDINIKIDYKNNTTEDFLYVDFSNEYNEYLNNFYFKLNGNNYKGFGFNYNLYLEFQEYDESKTSFFEEEKKEEEKESIFSDLLDNVTDNDLGSVKIYRTFLDFEYILFKNSIFTKKNILFFINEKDQYNTLEENEYEYIIEIYTKKHFETNNIFQLGFKNDEVYLDINDKKIKLITNNNILIKWINDIPFAYLYKDNDKYKIVFMDLDIMSKKLKSIWTDKNKLFGMEDEENDKYYTAEISYNGLELIFKNNESMYIYIKLCIFYSKSDCLFTLINKINLEEVKENHKQLFFLIYNSLFNSPYSYYFKQIIEINNNYKIDEDYLERLNRDSYPLKYKLFIKNENNINTIINKSNVLINDYQIRNIKEYDNLNITPFNGYEDDLNILNNLFDRNNKLNDDEDRYLNNIKKHYNKYNENILNNINDFINSYEKCEIKNDFNNPKDFIENFINRIKDIEDDLMELEEIIDNNIFDDIKEIILRYPENFYNLVNKKVLRETLSKILEKLEKKSTCIEISRIYDSIYKEVLYTGNRNKEIILFEIFFGNYIRKEQYEIYKNICDEIDEDQNPKYSIYQLLMGRGKTSVILPLVALKYTLKNDFEIKNNFICLPTHLVSQTYDEMKKKYSFMLNQYFIYKIEKIGRNNSDVDKDEDDEDDKDYDKDYYKNNLVKFHDIQIQKIKYESNYDLFIFLLKKIFIVECNSLKVLKLNSIENKFFYYEFDIKKDSVIIFDEFNIKKDSLIIFDEFDSLYDPLKSDLNFPIGKKQDIYNYIDEKILKFYVRLIKSIIINNKNINDKEDFKIFLNKLKIENELYKEYIDFILKRVKEENFINKIKENLTNNIIIDQISENDINIFYRGFLDQNEIQRIQNLQNDIDINPIFTKYEDYETKKFDIGNFYNKLGNKNNLIILKLYEILIICLNKIHNKDYGFPNEKSHNNLFISVPYSHVNNPVKNSNFSDLDINFFTTVLTYFYSDFRIFDIKNIIKIIKDKLDFYKDYVSDNILEEIINPYNLMINEKNISKLSNTNYDLDENKSLLNKYLDNFNNLDQKVKMNYKEIYILDNIINELKVSPRFYNCSFIDIMCKDFSLKKSGFSGTVNIKLPILDNSKIEDCYYKINEESIEYNNEFVRIKEISKDNGSIYIALLGLFEQNDLHFYNSEEKKDVKLDSIIKIINENNYDCFIDSGAFLIDFTIEEALKKFINNVENKNIFIYINNDDKKIIYYKNYEKEEPYNDEIFNKEDLFIYYDNKHIVGTDIKQPNDLKGLASISKFNKLTDVSQASFRLRNLNYGHTINFIIDEKINKIKNKIELLDYLDNNEIKYICNDSEIKKIEQNINYLSRSTNNYEVEKFIYYDYIKKLDNFNENFLYKNYYLNLIKDKKIKDKNLENLYNYLIKLLENNINFSNLEQEQEQQQNQNQNQNQNINMNISYEDYNTSNHIKTKEIIEYGITNLLNFDNNLNYFYKFKMDNLYFSHLFIGLNFFILNESNFFNKNFKWARDDNRYSLEGIYKVIKSLMSVFKTKNSYYLKKNDKYLVIHPIEFQILFDYYVNSENKKEFNNISIYDKYSRLIEFNNENQIDYKKEEDQEPINYFLKYILGGNLNIMDFFKMKLLNNDNMIDLIDIFEKTFLIKYPFKNIIYSKIPKEIDEDFIKNNLNINDQIAIDYLKKEINKLDQKGGLNLINYLIDKYRYNVKNSRLNNGKKLIYKKKKN